MSTELGMDFGSHRSGAGRIPAEQFSEDRLDDTPRCLTARPEHSTISEESPRPDGQHAALGLAPTVVATRDRFEQSMFGIKIIDCQSRESTT